MSLKRETLVLLEVRANRNFMDPVLTSKPHGKKDRKRFQWLLV